MEEKVEKSSREKKLTEGSGWTLQKLNEMERNDQVN